MRTMIALALLALVAPPVHADGYGRGRRDHQAAIGLFVVASALIVASVPLIWIGQGHTCVASVPVSCPMDARVTAGISLLAIGVAAHGVAMPLYLAGSAEIDRWRNGPPPALPVATVRF